jgi:Bifunctional DNA primase/polymerase, N-terminal
MKIIDYTKSYLVLGLPITLCYNKAPYYWGWQHRRFVPSEIERLFAANPNLNVGVILGPASNLIDIECDSDKAEENIQSLFDGNIPITATYQSKRGLHRLFQWDSRLSELGKAAFTSGGIDFRLGFNAAQSLLPPSITDGFQRQWIHDIRDYPALRLPETVLKKIVGAKFPW